MAIFKRLVPQVLFWTTLVVFVLVGLKRIRMGTTYAQLPAVNALTDIYAAYAPVCGQAYAAYAVTNYATGFMPVSAYGVTNATSVTFQAWSVDEYDHIESCNSMGGARCDPATQDCSQCDIATYTGTDQGGGVWTAQVNLANHQGEGTIYVPVYAEGVYGLGVSCFPPGDFTRENLMFNLFGLKVGPTPGTADLSPLSLPLCPPDVITTNYDGPPCVHTIQQATDPWNIFTSLFNR